MSSSADSLSVVGIIANVSCITEMLKCGLIFTLSTAAAFPLALFCPWSPKCESFCCSFFFFPHFFFNLSDTKTGKFFVLRLFALEQYFIRFVAMHTWNETDLSPRKVQSKL